ncbi:CO dehydrogenase/acetyl-CoA synthase complex beta subunit [Lachnospiraceae bacterium XBB1006]|nr:CO dehydrogenase/acetyl-CoA synthase complex beta subunit [Lachnospiraceae bacterium XBB1006]
MKLYDEVIGRVLEQLETKSGRTLPVLEDTWKSVTDRSMILRSDMAYELGGEGLPAIGMTLFTDSKEWSEKDSVTVIGEDLPMITGDVPYARVAIVQMEEGVLQEGERLYRAIRDLEYTRYHFYPEGFMMRVSSSKGRESVRVGKEALTKGLDFSKVGAQMIKAFHKHAGVKSVSLFYITKDTFDYKTLGSLQREAESITKAIDHISTGAIMDCTACNLQTVCDEVEGLRQLHFNKGE